MYQFFTENFNIFTNTFCGDWSGADSVWNSAGYAGQTESCASKTGYATCSDYVLNKGSAFTEAYWEVSHILIWTHVSKVVQLLMISGFVRQVLQPTFIGGQRNMVDRHQAHKITTRGSS